MYDYCFHTCCFSGTRLEVNYSRHISINVSSSTLPVCSHLYESGKEEVLGYISV